MVLNDRTKQFINPLSIIIEPIINLNMNNFELILSEPHTYQQPDLKSHQLSWSSFKNNLSALFNLQLSQLEPFLNKSKDIWG